ncbi:MAG: hypothetical protein II187_04080, partial [Treponema sp.]|nr:hypothetical protein [Treponema sp.]
AFFFSCNQIMPEWAKSIRKLSAGSSQRKKLCLCRGTCSEKYAPGGKTPNTAFCIIFVTWRMPCFQMPFFPL